MTENGDVAGRRAQRRHAPLRRGRDRRRRAARRLARRRAGRADRRHGPVRLGQVDADAHPRRARPADVRRRRIDGTRSRTLGDNDLTKLRREHIGFVFQFFNLLPMLTAEENILLPLSIAGEKPDRGVLRRPARATSASPTAARTARPSSPAASSSASRSRARSSRGRRSSSPTSRPATSTRKTSAEILELLRSSVESYGPDDGDGHARPRAAAIADRILFLADGLIVASSAADRSTTSSRRWTRSSA